MATKFLEPGGDANFSVDNVTSTGNTFWAGITNAPAVATDFVHGSHVKSIKCRPNVADWMLTSSGVLADAGSRISFYIYLVALPSATSTISRTGNSEFLIRITSAGVLQLANGTPSQIGSNGTTLSTGQWYRISLAYTVTSTTVNRFELFVNGVSSISVTNATLTTTGGNSMAIGNLNGNSTLDIRLSDHYADDSSSLTDMGDVWNTAKRPFSNGSSNQFTTQVGSGGSGYGSGHSPQVNERPLSETNGWSLSNTTKSTEEYTIEGQSTGDIDISGATIVDYMGWISAKVNSTANSPVHHIIVAGTATAKTMGTTQTIFTQIAGSTTYPGGNTDIGIDAQYTTTAHLTSLFECGVIVAFIPASTLTPSVSDSLTITESTTIVLVDDISISDSITINENTLLVVVSLVSISDSISVSESSAILIPILCPSVTDTVSVTENTSIFLPALCIGVNDSISISESVSMNESVSFSVSESISIIEEITLLAYAMPVTSDVQTIDEAIVIGEVSFIIASDSISITEGVTNLLTSNIFVEDDVAVSESVSVKATLLLSIFDSISISEQQTILIPILKVSVSDSLSVDDVVLFGSSLIPLSSDSVSVAESVNILIPFYFISVNESVVMTESTSIFLVNLAIRSNDNVSVSEFQSVFVTVGPSIYDEVLVSEQETISVTITDSLHEDVVVIENLSMTVSNPDSLVILSSDSLSVIESVSLAFSLIAIHATESIIVSESTIMGIQKVWRNFVIMNTYGSTNQIRKSKSYNTIQ